MPNHVLIDVSMAVAIAVVGRGQGRRECPWKVGDSSPSRKRKEHVIDEVQDYTLLEFTEDTEDNPARGGRNENAQRIQKKPCRSLVVRGKEECAIPQSGMTWHQLTML